MQNKGLIFIASVLFVVLVSMGGFLVFKNKNSINFSQEEENQVFPGLPKTTQTKYSDSGIQAVVPEVESEEENLTEAFTQILAEQIIQASLDPKKIDSEPDLSSIQSLEDIFVFPEILDQEIKIAENANYFQELNNIINQYFTSFTESDLDVINRALETQNYQELDKYILAYQGAYNKIKKLAVPQEHKEIHKDQLAILDIANQILEAIKNQEQDSIRAMAAISFYPEIEEKAYEFALKIYDLYQSQN